MALAYCSDCGHAVSAEAAACPKCARSLKPTPSRATITGKFLATAVPIIVGLATLVVGVREYRAAQTWKRYEFLANEMKEFQSQPSVPLVLQMLDWNARVYRLSVGSSDSVRVTDAMLQSAIVPHTERVGGGFTLVESLIRDHFDTFFNGLERFGTFVEAGLVTTDQLSPYIGYYLHMLGDTASGAKPPEVIRGIWRYLECYQFDGVQSLLQEWGYDVRVGRIEGCRPSDAGPRIRTDAKSAAVP